MRDMDITDARTFIVVAEAGSISRAARELHLTQPAVTRRIQRLEQAIGTRLIDRRKRPFALTDVGQAAIERCRRIVSMRDELKALAQGGAVPTRECRIGAAHALTELALTEPVDELRTAFPAVVPRLSTGWSRDLAERVRSGALDAAAVLLPRGDSLPAGVSGRELAAEQLQIVASRALHPRTLTLKEAAATEWILNPEGCGARAILQKAFGRAGLSLRVGVETYNYELQMSLVARGRGLGLVPSRLVARSAVKRQLSVLGVRGLEFPMTIWMLTAGLPSALEAALETFTDSLQRRLSPKRGTKS